MISHLGKKEKSLTSDKMSSSSNQQPENLSEENVPVVDVPGITLLEHHLNEENEVPVEDNQSQASEDNQSQEEEHQRPWHGCYMFSVNTYCFALLLMMWIPFVLLRAQTNIMETELKKVYRDYNRTLDPNIYFPQNLICNQSEIVNFIKNDIKDYYTRKEGSYESVIVDLMSKTMDCYESIIWIGLNVMLLVAPIYYNSKDMKNIRFSVDSIVSWSSFYKCFYFIIFPVLTLFLVIFSVGYHVDLINIISQAMEITKKYQETNYNRIKMNSLLIPSFIPLGLACIYLIYFAFWFSVFLYKVIRYRVLSRSVDMV